MFGPESKNSASEVKFAVSSPTTVTEEAAEGGKAKITGRKPSKPVSGKTTNNVSDQAEGKSEGSSLPESGTDAETDSDTPLAQRLSKVDLVSKLNSKYGGTASACAQVKQHWWKGAVGGGGVAPSSGLPRAVSLALLECPRCGQLFGETGALRRHQRERHPRERRGRTFRCDECRHALASQEKLRAHLRLHQAQVQTHLQAPSAYKCGRCEKVFARFHNFAAHTHAHARAFLCLECGAGFHDFAQFCGHMDGHGGGRAFRCCVCREVFRDPFALSPHMKTHR